MDIFDSQSARSAFGGYDKANHQFLIFQPCDGEILTLFKVESVWVGDFIYYKATYVDEHQHVHIKTQKIAKDALKNVSKS